MKKRPVYQISMEDLSIIKEWESVSLAAQEMLFPQPAICAAAQGKRISANGYYWCYIDEFEHFVPKKRKTKAVICLETGEVFSSVKEAAAHLECTETVIRKSCGDIGHTAAKGKWHLQYFEDYQNSL